MSRTPDWEEVFTRPAPKDEHGARASLEQLEKAGFGVEVLERDSFGPLLLRRRSMVDTTWRRVSGKGKEAMFEQESSDA